MQGCIKLYLMYPVCLVPATSIAPQLSTASPSDTAETVSVPEDASNAVFKFADSSLRLSVGAGMSTLTEQKFFSLQYYQCFLFIYYYYYYYFSDPKLQNTI